MSTKNPKGLALILALSFCAAAAQGAFSQTYTFGNFVPSSPSGTYDWDGTTQIPITGYVNYSSTKTRFCFWAFVPDTGSRFFSYNGNTIPYSIHKFISSTVGNELWAWTHTPRPTTDNVLSVTFYGSATNVPLYFIVIPQPGYLKPAGTYTSTITVYYYSATLTGTTISSANQRATKAVTVSLSNPAICDLALVAPSEGFSIGATTKSLPFGDITNATNPSLQAKAIVRSNATSWSLFAQSANAGVLKTGTQTIPYTFSYNGSVKTLTTSPQLMETGNWAATGNTGFAERLMTITLGETFVPPGTYTDTITFTMTYNG
ncbi:MAG TPA: hypothetical protein VIO60_09020 [Rectinemataceae bacterium]